MKIYKNKIINRAVPPIYLLPNMVTLGAMCFGFYAIIQSIRGNFIYAGNAVFFAMILDTLDGRIARLTNTASPFGAQLDSISDMVNFGVMPSIMILMSHLYIIGNVSWLFAFIYCACTSLRLARFNTMLNIKDKNYFTGMPSPTGAALVIGYVYICSYYNLYGYFYIYLAVFITLFSAFSMVSNVKFYSFKEFHFHKTARFRVLLMFLIILVSIFLYPEIVIYSFFIIYTLTSYIMWLFKLKTSRIK